MNMQELLQKRAKAIKAQEEIMSKAAGGLTAEMEKNFNDLQQEINECDRQIEMLEQVDENAKKNYGGSVFGNSGPAVHIDPVKDGAKDNGGFKSLGEVLHAVKYGDKKGRLENLKAQNTADGASGGYLIPEQFSDELLMVGEKRSLIRPFALVIPAGEYPDAAINMPALDYTAGNEGGVTVKWIEEGEEKPESNASFRNVELKPKEVAGFITVTDTLLRNAPASSTIFGQLLSNAIVRAEDRAFINGNGIGKPLGFATNGNGGKLVVQRETAGKVTTNDVANMMAAFPPEDIPDSIFLASSTILADLIKLQDASGRFVFVQGDLTKGIPTTLMGMPLFLTGMNASHGNTGDLQLVNLKKYLIKDGSGIYISMSEHVKFTSNQTVIKAFRNVDGKPWVNAPYMLDSGVQVSPYVLLGGTTAATTPISDLTAAATGSNVKLTFTAAKNANSVNIMRSDDGVTYQRINVNAVSVDAAEYTDTNLANGTYGYKVVVTGGENAGVSNAATATVTGIAAANKTASAPKE